MPHLEHIGIAVENVEAAVDCFRDVLGEKPYKRETVAEQQVRTHLLDADTAKLELLEALSDDSPVQRFLDREGEGLHHLAFEVADLAATVHRLREAGFELLSDTPQDGADDKQIAFVHPKQTHGVLVEFCESVAPSWSALEVPRHDGPLAVFERGPRSRPTLLVLHGAAGSTRLETAPLMRRLESSFHLVGVDLSGHGTSAFPTDQDFSLDLFAEDVRTAMTALDLSSAHVFGFSLGGGVALHLAQRSPALVDRLAVFQTNVDWTRPQANRMRQRLDLDALQENAPEHAERLRAHHSFPTRLLQRLQSFVKTLPDASGELAPGLSDLSTPTLVGSVDQDPLFGPEAPQALHQQLPNARLAILPGEHHDLAKAPLPLLSSLLKQHFSVN
ncbi:MAG: methylmalonyl-CoA epimerase [Bacteroidetes bacterium QS_1_65_9]|nr:MAG: methylmalonyl-CoA epimerase [Bacteroidetes bacterium QS_1_65_9]